jgi:hypothetical protein
METGSEAIERRVQFSKLQYLLAGPWAAINGYPFEGRQAGQVVESFMEANG